jgi:hypothetical protein
MQRVEPSFTSASVEGSPRHLFLYQKNGWDGIQETRYYLWQDDLWNRDLCELEEHEECF